MTTLQDTTEKLTDYTRQFQDGLITEPEWLNAILNAAMTRRQFIDREAHTKLGAWMSAALDDPQVCKEMKDDINNWMSVNYHHTIPDPAGTSRTS